MRTFTPNLAATRISLEDCMSKAIDNHRRSISAAGAALAASQGSPRPETPQRPVIVPDLGEPDPKLSRLALAGLVVAGIVVGLGIHRILNARPTSSASVGPRTLQMVPVERKGFENTLRTGGTVGATNFAMIRAPRMRGGRDRGGGGSLTIESLAEPGSIVQQGDVVAVFESKRTADMLDNYESNLAQTQRRATSQKASLLISTETLRQSHRKAEAEAAKADLDLGTAEVKSEIQAEILGLLAQQNAASARQLEEEVRLTEISDAAAVRSMDIDVQQSRNRLERTKGDLEKMRLRTPVSGLVVVETTFQRDKFAQAAAGDQVNPGSYFLRIVDLSKMAVFADVNQADTQQIQIGAAVKIELDAYPGAVFDGRVVSIGAMAVAGGSSGGGGRGMRGSRGGSSGHWVRKVPIQIEILSRDDRIKPDLSASADIVLREEEDALVIPRAALGHSGGRDIVWVREGERFVERPVEVGLLSDTEATVRAGLSEGEMIAAQKVTDPAMLLDPEAG